MKKKMSLINQCYSQLEENETKQIQGGKKATGCASGGCGVICGCSCSCTLGIGTEGGRVNTTETGYSNVANNSGMAS